MLGTGIYHISSEKFLTTLEVLWGLSAGRFVSLNRFVAVKLAMGCVWSQLIGKKRRVDVGTFIYMDLVLRNSSALGTGIVGEVIAF